MKIDRSLILGLDGAGPEAVAIVSAIIRMAKALGLVALAVGVESESTARLLLDLGCDQAQGYLFGRPRAEAELGASLNPMAHQAVALQISSGAV